MKDARLHKTADVASAQHVQNDRRGQSKRRGCENHWASEHSSPSAVPRREPSRLVGRVDYHCRRWRRWTCTRTGDGTAKRVAAALWDEGSGAPQPRSAASLPWALGLSLITCLEVCSFTADFVSQLGGGTTTTNTALLPYMHMCRPHRPLLRVLRVDPPIFTNRIPIKKNSSFSTQKVFFGWPSRMTPEPPPSLNTLNRP